MKTKRCSRREGYRNIPDVLWEKMEALLPVCKKSAKGGRPRRNLRDVLNGIFYVLRTGSQWRMMPKEYPPGQTCHRYFQQLNQAGVFQNLWQLVLLEYDNVQGIDWHWQSIDSHTIQAPVKGAA
jgi:putative transposase